MKTAFTFSTAALLFSLAVNAQTSIAPKDATKYVGEKVTVCGKSTTRQSGSRVLISLGAANNFNVVINQEDLKNFPYKPEEYLTNKNVCVVGKVTDQNGKAEITVRKSDSIKVDDGGDDDEIKPLSMEGLNRYFEED